jgi:DnaJ domain
MLKHDCFDVLQVPETVSAEELRRAYRRLVRRWHPDQYSDAPGMREIAQERLKLINTAYQEAKGMLAAGAGDRDHSAPPQRPSNRFPGWLRAIFSSGKAPKPRPSVDPGSGAQPRPKRPGAVKDFEAVFQEAIRRRRAASGGAALQRSPRPVRRKRGDAPTGGRRSRPPGTSVPQVERIRRIRRVEKV